MGSGTADKLRCTSYDGDKPVSEIDGTGAITAVNTWGANGLVSRDTSAGSAFYTFDPQGSVCQKLDGTATPLLSTMFDAYGSPASTNSDPYNAPGAQFGNYRDAETGLVWMGHRYCDPTSGRFLTRDPAEEGTGTNEYAYTDNNPVTRYDATGLAWAGNSDIAPDGENRNTWQYAFKLNDAALINQMTDGNYDGGIYRCDPNWDLMKTLWGVAWTGINMALGDELALSEEVPEIGVCGKIGGGCFTAGTPVQMSDGSTKPVEQVKTGDAVESRNETTGKTEPEKVTATIKHYNVPTVTLTFSNGDQVVTTGVHPFYVQDKGFVPASDLAIGNAIVTRAGPSVTITKIEQTEPETVYNLTVDGDHTYFVGSKDGGVWVHNTEPLVCPSEEGEIFYRTMRERHYKRLLKSGKMPATGETFTSPTQEFAENYDGALVKFQMQPGTKSSLEGIGVRNDTEQTAETYPDMPLVQEGWNTKNAFFKSEGGQINIGLGKGPGIDLFNSNIIGFQRIR